jgi:hypothetical protein
VYQLRKKIRPSTLLLITDSKCYLIIYSGIISSNHSTAFQPDKADAKIFDKMELAGLSIRGLFLDVDTGFDIQIFTALCFSKDIIYNKDQKKRN